MSDRQTPTTIIDRVYACRRQAMMAGLSPRTIVMCEGDVRRMAGETPPEMLTHKDDVLKQRRDRRSLTLSQFEDQAVEAAKAGEMFLYGMQVRLDDSAVEIRCEGATRGVKEYRGDQHAGVDNSVQAAQGCRLAAGVSDGADLCTLGTADFSIRSGHDVVADMEMAFAAMAQHHPIPATGMADVFLYPGEFDMVVRAQGIETQSFAGQQYWEWQGGGIRYWRGHREMPIAAA